MQKIKGPDLAGYIYPLYANRLQGRLMYWPKDKNISSRNILLVYDLNDSIESCSEYIKALSRFGSVTCIDLPGLGGMESFYKINSRPTLEAFADYLASLIKLRFRGKKLTIVALGYGFVISTRMLQNYPEIAKRTNLVVGVGGYSRYDDLAPSNDTRLLRRFLTFFSSLMIPSAVLKLILVNNFSLKNKSVFSRSEKEFLNSLDETEKNNYFEQLITIWKTRSLRTYLLSLNEITKLDNCKKSLSVPLWQIFIDSDRFDNHVVEQHLRVIFKDFHSAKVSIDDILLPMQNSKAANRLLPVKLRRVLVKE